MTISEADLILSNVLKDVYSSRETKQIGKIFWEDLFASRGGIDRVLHTQEVSRFNLAVEKLRLKMPIQYVTGVSYFYDVKLEVNENVLIPRPETEELVDLFLKENKHLETARILDVGTGSGCIPISIKKKCPQFEIHAIDISDRALALAKSNAERNEVRINFQEQDFLKEVNWDTLGMFDFIISNPPYIPDHEKAVMSESALLYEPNIALFSNDEDGLIFYKKLAKMGQSKLRSKGSLYVECNEFNAKEVVNTFADASYSDVSLIKDMQEKDRIVVARR